MAVAINFENISKQYRLGLVSTQTLSHDLNRWWQTSILRKEDPYLKIGETNDRSKKGESEYIWALKNITFDVEQGEVLGIIGKNGAGKSTLLKILSRVTTPTTGIIKAKGRIASLLEVGTGFHPELTGRENVYMNGSIMGMTRKEINRKLDEIVDFAGVERYLDTPVKRYSSGMTVRLGFSIAAHLEPEILVVDEVLAVGDAEFQKKAIGKMQDVSKGEGRTVLFVSHNMQSIQTLCSKCVLLIDGCVDTYDVTLDVIRKYQANQIIYQQFINTRDIRKEVQIVEGKIADITDDTLAVDLVIESNNDIKSSLDIRLLDSSSNPCAYGSIGALNYEDLVHIKKGKNKFTIEIDTSYLAIGNYIISFDLTVPNIKYLDRLDSCLMFEITKSLKNINKRILDMKWNYGCFTLNIKKRDEMVV